MNSALIGLGAVFIVIGIIIFVTKPKRGGTTQGVSLLADISSNTAVSSAVPSAAPSAAPAPEPTPADQARRSYIDKLREKRRAEREKRRADREKRRSERENYEINKCSTTVTTTVNGVTQTEKNEDCVSLVEYQVDGTTYFVENNSGEMTEDSNVEVYYNTENPSDASTSSTMLHNIFGSIFIIGGVLLVGSGFLIKAKRPPQRSITNQLKAQQQAGIAEQRRINNQMIAEKP